MWLCLSLAACQKKKQLLSQLLSLLCVCVCAFELTCGGVFVTALWHIGICMLNVQRVVWLVHYRVFTNSNAVCFCLVTSYDN